MTEAFFLQAFGKFLISLVRITGFFLVTPAFGESVIPVRLKAGISAFCALLILPHLLKTQPLPELTPLEYGIMAIKELALGFTIGFVVLIAIDTLKFAGEVMGMQIGFSFVQVIDPDSNRGEALVAELMQVLGVILFLLMNGHIMVLQAFIQSFYLIPLAGYTVGNGVIAEFIRLISTIMFIGLQIAMPVIATILSGDVALGIIARTVPRMNIFQVGFPIKIILGIIMMILLVPFWAEFLTRLINNSSAEINAILRMAGK